MGKFDTFAQTTVVAYDLDKDGNYFTSRVTLACHMIQAVIAMDSLSAPVEGRELKDVQVCMLEGRDIRILISEVDLINLERAVGTYPLS
jgi:hypothetical protein